MTNTYTFETVQPKVKKETPKTKRNIRGTLPITQKKYFDEFTKKYVSIVPGTHVSSAELQKEYETFITPVVEEFRKKHTGPGKFEASVCKVSKASFSACFLRAMNQQSKVSVERDGDVYANVTLARYLKD